MEASPKFEPVNYVELIGDLESRVQNLERRFGYILDGIGRIIEDGEMMGAHLQNLRKIGKWSRGRNSIDVEQKPKLIR